MTPSKLRFRWIVSSIVFGTILLTGGCAAEVTVPSSVSEDVRSIQAQLTRAEVREILGKPYFQNEQLRVEAYRMTGIDVDVLLVFFVLPIPFPGQWHEHHIFIAYDQAWKVFKSAIGMDYLRAGGLTLATTSVGDRPEVLLATMEMSRQAWSTPPKEGKCALILLSRLPVMERVLVDGVQLIDLGPGSHYLSSTFSRHEIDAGEHTIVVQQSLTEKYHQKFSCKPGTQSFVRLGPQNIEQNREGKIVITTKLPYRDGVLQILAHDDDWFGFAESYYAGAADRRGIEPWQKTADQRQAGLKTRSEGSGADRQGITANQKTADQRQAELHTRAESGGAEDQYRLGRYFYEKTFVLQGTARDDAVSRAWYWTCLAANNGLSVAQSLLGFWHSQEVSERRIAPGPMDFRQAYLWYSLAATKGRPDAKAGQAKLTEIMSSSSISEAKRLVSDWQPDAASCGVKPSAGKGA